jgi:hypothetical protein
LHQGGIETLKAGAVAASMHCVQEITLRPLLRRQYGAGGIHAAKGFVTA